MTAINITEEKREMTERRRLHLRGNDDAPQTLEQRITRALAPETDIASSAIAALFGEVESAIADAQANAEAAKTRALDPTISDIEAARRDRGDAGFRLERLKAALAPLQQRYNQVRTRERRAQWRANYADVKAKRDATAAQLQAIYQEFTTKLIAALIEAKQIDQEVARINSTAPNGEHDRLLDTECAARGVNAVGPNGLLSLMTELRMPHWSAPGLAWPPPPPPIDVLQVIPAAMLTHPGANWAAHQKEAKAQADAAAKRVAEFYRRQEREKEDLENARARAEQERRRQAAST